MKKLLSFFALILFSGMRGMNPSVSVQRLQQKVARLEKSIAHLTQKYQHLDYEIEFFRNRNQELRNKCGIK